jgi:hypothetical protein
MRGPMAARAVPPTSSARRRSEAGNERFIEKIPQKKQGCSFLKKRTKKLSPGASRA